VAEKKNPIVQLSQVMDKYLAEDSISMRSATIKYYNAERSLSQVKYRHDSQYNLLLAQNLLVGKNEAARYGGFIMEEPDLVAELQRAEEDIINARRELEMARIDHSYANKRFQLFQMFAPGIANSPEEVNSLWHEGAKEEKQSSETEQPTQSGGQKKGSG